MNNSVQAFGTTANTSHQSLEQLSDMVQNLSGMSTAQSEILNTICNAILELRKQQVPAAEVSQHNGIPSEGPTYSEEMEMEMEIDTETQDSSDDGNGLLHVLDRLCHLAQEIGKTVFSEEAEKSIHDIQDIFELLLQAEEQEHGRESKGKRLWESCDTDNTEDHLLDQPEVKRIKGLLSASHCISINEKCQ
ncbi:MAG: hypothetical protein Q9184_006067 [Pyrenodesmia sp. 2 TL-2023]